MYFTMVIYFFFFSHQTEDKLTSCCILHLTSGYFEASIFCSCCNSLCKICIGKKWSIWRANARPPAWDVIFFGGWTPAIDHGPCHRALQIPNAGGRRLLKATQKESSVLHLGNLYICLILFLLWCVSIHIRDQGPWDISIGMWWGDRPWRGWRTHRLTSA